MARTHDFISHKPNVMDENQISYKIRGAIFKVYNYFGPGLLESIYEEALFEELRNTGLHIKKQVPVKVDYYHRTLGVGFRIDLIVEDKVIIEIKSIENLAKVHFKQVLSYLKITGCKLGILVNFASSDINTNIYRIVNDL